MNMIYAAGIVTYTLDNGQIRYLLLRHAAGHWGIPKGRRDPGETDEQTAIRELYEEAGLTIKDFDPTFFIATSYTVLDAPKTVTYFVGQATDFTVTLSHEHDQFAWCTFEDAMKLLTHQGSKEILAKAQEYVHQSHKLI